jgi:HrpA-like RNA helicase
LQHIKKTFKNNAAWMPNILVFLPSVKDIKNIIAHIHEDSQEHFKRINDEVHFILQELHGAQKPSEKNKVINPDKDLDGCVIVIFATKIAETAITLKDIYYVLDSGLEREYFYDEVSKMSFIQECKISKSSADQRKGRAGRVGNGYCFKMYREEEEIKFRANKIPEVQRMDISDIILSQIKLQSLFKLSDVMFYDTDGFTTNKIILIQAEMHRIMATTPVKGSTRLTQKGEFILGMSCSTLVAAFLFECYKLGVDEFGVISASSLENIKGFFKENVQLCINTASLEGLLRQRNDGRRSRR